MVLPTLRKVLKAAKEAFGCANNSEQPRFWIHYNFKRDRCFGMCFFAGIEEFKEKLDDYPDEVLEDMKIGRFPKTWGKEDAKRFCSVVQEKGPEMESIHFDCLDRLHDVALSTLVEEMASMLSPPTISNWTFDAWCELPLTIRAIRRLKHLENLSIYGLDSKASFEGLADSILEMPRLRSLFITSPRLDDPVACLELLQHAMGCKEGVQYVEYLSKNQRDGLAHSFRVVLDGTNPRPSSYKPKPNVQQFLDLLQRTGRIHAIPAGDNDNNGTENPRPEEPALVHAVCVVRELALVEDDLALEAVYCLLRRLEPREYIGPLSTCPTGMGPLPRLQRCEECGANSPAWVAACRHCGNPNRKVVGLATMQADDSALAGKCKADDSSE